MDSSVSPKDEIWFLRVYHHISTGLYHQGLHSEILRCSFLRVDFFYVDLTINSDYFPLNIKRMAFIIETEYVYSAVRTEFLNIFFKLIVVVNELAGSVNGVDTHCVYSVQEMSCSYGIRMFISFTPKTDPKLIYRCTFL